MNFPSLIAIPLPKFSNHDLQLTDQTLRELKTTHCIGYNGLYHGLDQHLFTGLRQEFLFPPFKLLPHTLLNVRKTFFFPLPTKAGRPRYFSKFLMEGTSRSCWILSSTSREVLVLKKRLVLSLFIFCPLLFHRWPKCLK